MQIQTFFFNLSFNVQKLNIFFIRNLGLGKALLRGLKVSNEFLNFVAIFGYFRVVFEEIFSILNFLNSQFVF